MPPTPDLATRILAEIEDAEEDARKAIGEFDGPYWTLLATDNVIYSGQAGETAWSVLEQLSRRGPQLGDHIVRNDPHAVLRRCAADRTLIAYTQAWPHRNCEDSHYACPQALLPGCVDPCDCGVDEHRETVLRGLAAGYGLLVADELPEAVS